MSKLANLYIGRAGQMAVMSEFLIRGYNVAIPEVDVGDDIFVVRDSDGEYSRIQVKTTNATKTQMGYSARYTLKLKQLQNPSTPEIWYVFANRLLGTWESFIVIARQELVDLYNLHQIGSLSQNEILSLYFAYSASKVLCSGQDFTAYLDNWNGWPPIAH